jgi:hypothetical protein
MPGLEARYSADVVAALGYFRPIQTVLPAGRCRLGPKGNL